LPSFRSFYNAIFCSANILSAQTSLDDHAKSQQCDVAVLEVYQFLPVISV